MAKQALLVPIVGQFPVEPTLRVQPTVQRASGTANVGAKLRRRYTITNNLTVPIADYPYLITIGETATAFVAAGKALASGNDVRFVLDGLEVARTLKGWNSASSSAWIIIPYLAAGASITYDMLYSNASAGTPPTLLLGFDATIFDPATSTNAVFKYLTDDTAANAAKGIWHQSTGVAVPQVQFGLPGSWTPATTMASDDDRRQTLSTSYVDTAVTYYHAILDAKRQRNGTMTANEKNGADGIVLKVPTGITSITADFLWTNLARGTNDTTPVGQLVIVTRNSDNEPWQVLQSFNALAETPTTIAAATYTPSAAVKQLAIGVWPYSGGRIGREARSDRYVSAQSGAQLDIAIDSSGLVQTTAQGETTVYELATELRSNGGGAAVGVAPYHSIYLGNAKSASGRGTPRLTLELNNQLQLKGDTRRPEIWNSGVTAKVENVPLDTVNAVDAVLDGVTGLLVERDAQSWMPLLPVQNPIPNPSFATDLTGWSASFTHASITAARTRDAAIFSDAAGSHKLAITASTAPTTTLVAQDMNATYFPVGGRQSVVVSADKRGSTLNLQQYLRIDFFTEALGFISAALEAFASSAVSAVDTWERHTFAARVPDGAAYWQFKRDVYSNLVNATGNVYLDNVRAFDTDIVLIDVSKGTLVLTVAWLSRYAYA